MKPRKLVYLTPSQKLDNWIPPISSAGWEVCTTGDMHKAKEWITHRDIHVGIFLYDPCDIKQLHEFIKHLSPLEIPIKWVVLLSPTCLEDINVCKSITDFFYDYVTLPVDPNRLTVILGHAYGMAQLDHLLARQREHSLGEQGLIGSSPLMKDLFRNIHKIALTNAPVLITGESGTGKELVAQAIHKYSPRSKGPFIAVNCGALPTNLIQSELFGHEKGAFTGAAQRKLGRIELAAGGTIFLDEIGDLSLDLQVNLLRFLQEKTIERVGGTTNIPIDVRVVAATYIDLEKAVQEGRFREDLFYRLNVLHLKTPALRQRGKDIELLAQHFLDRFSSEVHSSVKGFSQEALQVMKNYRWPGNVRELINRVWRAAVMCEGRMITPEQLDLEEVETPSQALVTLSEARALAEKEIVERTLWYTGNNVSKAASILGVSRPTLYRLMEEYGFTR